MNTATKTIAIYPGRFQPFGPHHFAVYRRLCERFGQGNVFITTTNFVDTDRCPLSFPEKSQVIQRFGVPKQQICCVSSTYKSAELLEHFNSSTTSVIFVYGEKDNGRINYFKTDGSQSYFTPYRGQTTLEPFSTVGYILVAPQVNLSVDDNEVSGTLLRKILTNSDESKFKSIMGWYDSVIHAIFKRKFKDEVDEAINALLAPLTEGNAITKTQLLRIEQYADKLFREFGIDVEFQDIFKGTHFFQRLNDPRNGSPITTDELRLLFKKVSSKYGDKLSNLTTGAEGVFKDMESDVNMPFVIKYDAKNREIDLIPKTIMRKPDFKSSTPFYTVESVDKNTRHIMHPFEDENLTYGELLDMMGTLCNNPKEIAASVKIDGQNCKFVVVGGKVFARRGKNDVLTKEQLLDKFELPQVKLTFDKAFDEMKSWIRINSLTDITLNVELCDPQNINVINNGQEFKIFVHTSLKNVKWTNTIQPTPIIKLKPIANVEKYLNVVVQLADAVLDAPIKNTDQLQICLQKMGSEILKTNSKGSTNEIIARLEVVADQIPASEPKLQDKYMKNIQRLIQIGGTRSIAPIEGFVFRWKNGNQYKITGAFSPVNQILGLFKYNG